ncbi:MAG: ribonuclease [Clostridiales bacterium]|nr:ribonuclease [Clostridiales bacterium]
MRRNRLAAVFVLLLAAVMLLTGCAASASGNRNQNAAKPEATTTPGPMDDAQRIADYIFEYGKLPDNFIRKQEAERLGWDPRMGINLSDVAPGKSIGGDRFGNYEERLPVVQGRKYYEADCWYRGGRRNAYRIIYSNDGHVWYTGDHYETFVELFPSGEKNE